MVGVAVGDGVGMGSSPVDSPGLGMVVTQPTVTRSNTSEMTGITGGIPKLTGAVLRINRARGNFTELSFTDPSGAW
jgi:hypothetical protein